MKTILRPLAVLSVTLGALLPVQGEVLDTLAEYGNAINGNPTSANGTARGFTNNAVGEYTITAGGTDFWDASDHGSFIYDADQTRTGNFSATVRSVSVAEGETLAGEWGRTGLMARASGAAANSAYVAHIRKTGGGDAGTQLQFRDSTGAGTGNTPVGNGAANIANGSVQNTPIWLGLHRYNGIWYTTWAPDAAGSPGVWSAPTQRAATPAQNDAVTVGLAHQSHDIHPQVNTAVFEHFSVGDFDSTAGAFPVSYSASLAFNGNEVFLTASGLELGAPAPQDVNWEVRFVGPEQLTPGGLKADIYLQGNQGNLGAFNTMTMGIPDGTARIQRINWAAGDYTSMGTGGQNLFALAVPGSFVPGGNGQENYGIHLTGEIFIPSDADRGGVEEVAFHDGVDDYCLLQVDGVTLIDDNSWSNRAGTENGGAAQGILDVSDPKFDNGEWVSFRMGTWEGGGGDDAYLVWDALDRTGSDSNTGGVDNALNTYTGAFLGGGNNRNFANHVSDEIPPANFRSLTGGTLATQSGSGQPNNLLLTQLLNNPPVVGTKAIEVYLDGQLVTSVPVEPSIDSADFTAFDTVTIVLADVGGGGTSDVNPATITVTRDGVPISPTISKSGVLTTIVDTFPTQPAPFTFFNYQVSGNTTPATGSEAFTLGANIRSFAILGVLREGLADPPNATVGWEVMEFTGAVLGGADQGYRDAQNIIHDGTPAFTAIQPFINHADPETNAASGEWFPDLPILSNTAGDDDNYVTFARTIVTIAAGDEGLYTLRIAGDDGYGIRVNGATAVSVTGDGTNRVDARDSSVFFPNFTGNSNAFAVFNFPTAGDYLVEFFGFEGGGGSFQEIAWAPGALTAIGQSAQWALLGNMTGFTFQSVWGTIPESVLPPLPTSAPGGWATHIWYGATNGASQAVDNLDQTMRFLRDLEAFASTFTADFQGELLQLNHADNAGGGGVFGGNAAFPGDPTPGADTDRIAMLARALIVAPADGDYSLQVRSDDGFLLRFADPANQFHSINGAGQLHPSAPNEITHPAGTGDSNTRAAVFLTQGTHEIQFVWWEGAGGAHFEISSAPGVVLNHGPEYALLTPTPNAPNLWLGLDVPDPIRITNFLYNQVDQTFTLTWSSEPNRIYGLFYSEDLLSPAFGADVDDSILSGGNTTTYGPFPHPFGEPRPPDLFFRVEDLGPSN